MRLADAPALRSALRASLRAGAFETPIRNDQTDTSTMTGWGQFKPPLWGQCRLPFSVREEVLDRYLDESVKAYRPPRFLLNDVVRYWRTICVDFAGKEHEGPRKWGLRNAKLRTSRKILFAGGLLPVLECFRFDLAGIRGYLEGQLAMLPTDRIAQSFLVHNAVEPGARTFGAYDEFVGRMNDEEFRDELGDVARDNCADSSAFADVQRIGRELQDGLLSLLYETRALPQVVRDYAIF